MFLTDVDHFAGIFDAFIGQLGDVDEAFDAIFHFGKGAEVGELGDLGVDNFARGIALGQGLPRIGLQLLDTQGESLVLNIDVEDDGLHLFAHFVEGRGVSDLLRPTDVTDVYQSVDAFLDADEDTEVGDVANLPEDSGADGVFVFQKGPGVGLDLLDAQTDLLGVRVEVEDHTFDDLALADDAVGMLDATRPAHLRDVDEALDAFLEFDESAVIDEADDAAEHVDAVGVALFGAFPGVGRQLLVAQADALAVGAELQDLDLNLVAHIEELGGMRHASPAHIGDVEKAVDATEVDKRTVVGEVFDDAVDDSAGFQLLEGLFLESRPLFFKKGTAAKHDIAAVLVEFDDLEGKFLAQVLVEVSRGAKLDLGTGKEGLDADVDLEATFDTVGDDATDQFVLVVLGGDDLPDLHAVGAFFGEDTLSLFVFALFEEHVDDVAGLDGDLTVFVGELVDVDAAFGFEANIDEDILLADLQNATVGDLILLDGLE